MTSADGTRPLAIADPRVLVRVANQRLVMVREGTTVATIPLAEVSHVAVHGPATLTGAALAALLDRGIDVSLHTSAGRYRGLASGVQSKNVFLLLAQVTAWQQPERRLEVVRCIVASKVEGQRQLLQRKAIDRESSECRAAVDALGRLAPSIETASAVDVLRGYEGAGSAAYFAAFGSALSPPWTFPGRVRRPPRDPVNALLSFGYTLATAEVTRHLVRAGFDPRIGLLHGIRYGRVSLALDLVDEFRTPMVDRFTLALLNRRQLRSDDFETHDDGAVRLTAEGRRKYLELWESMLGAGGTVGRGPSPDGATDDDRSRSSWRERIARQAHRLRIHLLDGAAYRPLTAPRPTTPEKGQRRSPH